MPIPSEINWQRYVGTDMLLHMRKSLRRVSWRRGERECAGREGTFVGWGLWNAWFGERGGAVERFGHIRLRAVSEG